MIYCCCCNFTLQDTPGYFGIMTGNKIWSNSRYELGSKESNIICCVEIRLKNSKGKRCAELNYKVMI